MRKAMLFSLMIAFATALTARTGSAQSTIDTHAGWNGTDFAFEFGAGNTATYGQTFIAQGNVLNDFSFWLSNYNNGGALQFSAYVGTWNGTSVGSILWSSAGTFNGTGASSFSQYLFNTGALSLTDGGTYVAFLNASPFVLSNPGTTAQDEFGADYSNPYAQGAYVFTNNGGDFDGIYSAWEQPGDDGFYGNGFDLAFKADFNQSLSTVPEPGSLTLLATGLVGLTGMVRRRRIAR